jgi:hypothetical protein
VSRESVSFTDMKTGITFEAHYNFDWSCICRGYSAQHNDVFLTTS